VKPVVIIVISVVCSVAAIGVIELIVYGVDVGEIVTNIVPFDCAKAWETMMGSLRIQDNDAFQKLSPEERMEIRNYHGNIRDEFHANWCYLNHEEWEGRVEAYKEAFAASYFVDYRASWERAISSEFEYNAKFPDGGYPD